VPRIEHTAEQGQRVHWLANLGGLVAIAGLEEVEPDLLLGALLSVAAQLRRPDAAGGLQPVGPARSRRAGADRRRELIRAADARRPPDFASAERVG